MDEGLQDSVVAHGNLVKNKTKQRGLWRSFYQPFKPTVFTHPLWCFDANITGETNNISPQGLPVFSSLQWKKHSCVYRRPVPPSGLPRLNPPTPHPLKSTPLCSSFSLSSPASSSPSIQEHTYQHPDMLYYFPSHKTKDLPSNQKPLCLNISFQPLPHFSCFLYGKTSQKSNPDLLQMEELVNQHLLSFRDSASPGCSVHTPLVSFFFFFDLVRCFFPWVLARFILARMNLEREKKRKEKEKELSFLSSLVIYSNP